MHSKLKSKISKFIVHVIGFSCDTTMVRFVVRLPTILVISCITIILLYFLYEFLKTSEISNVTLPSVFIEQTPSPPEIDYVSRRLRMKRSFNTEPVCSRPSPRMIELYKSQAPQRRAYFQIVLDSPSKNYMYLYNNLAPEVFCPELVRVGTTNDGGKWICSPFRIPSQCNILSLGLYNEVTFEQELQHIIKNRCNIYAYDMNEQLPRTIEIFKEIRTKSKVAMISDFTDESKNVYTIEYLLNLEGITDFEILKVDIEGSELTVIPELLIKHRPAQIMIEIHGTPSEATSLLRTISNHGYWLYSYEINGA
ncbi:hypothetical protein DICVIV_13370, partial [Dictyocaulus viviparus]